MASDGMTGSLEDNKKLKKKSVSVYECPICKEEFRNPKYLPCLHTFCETCLQRHIESTVKTNDRTHPSIICPVCRMLAPVPADSATPIDKWATTIPFNHLIFSMMAKMRSNEKKERYNCDPCRRIGDNSVATHWCQKCNELLCRACLKNFHNRLKNSDLHPVLDISEANILPQSVVSNVEEPCSEHKGKYYEVYCLDHSQMCCVLCLAINHRECRNIKTIDEVVDQFTTCKQEVDIIKDLTFLSSELDKFILKKTEQIDRICNENERLVLNSERHIDLAISKLQKMKLKLKDDISNTCQMEIKPIEIQKEACVGFHENILQSIRFLTTITEHGNSKQIFLTLQKIKDNLYIQRDQINKRLSDVDSAFYEVTIDPSIMAFIRNTGSCFETTTKRSKGWKDMSRIQMSTKMDTLCNRLTTMICPITRNKSVNKSDGSDLNVDSIHLDECNVEDVGVVSDSSEEQINESEFLEFSDSTEQGKDESVYFQHYTASEKGKDESAYFKDDTKHKNKNRKQKERKSGMREKRRFHNQYIH